MSHLTSKQLMVYRDGESDDPGVEQHLASCDTCRRRLGDSRLLALLARASEPGPPPSSHPSPEKLAAYHDQTLSRSQTLNVEKHLRLCETCLTQVIMLRRDLAVPAEYSPDEALVEHVKSRFRPPPPRRLGQVILELLTETGGIRLLPTYAEASGPSISWARSHLLAALRRSETQEAFFSTLNMAGLPAITYEEIEDKFRKTIDAFRKASLGATRLPPLSLRQTLTLVYSTDRARGPSASKVQPVEFVTESLHLSLIFTLKGRRVHLLVKAADEGSGKPLQGLHVALVPAAPAHLPAGEKFRTDRRGQARFVIPEGESELLVSTESQTCTLELRFIQP